MEPPLPTAKPKGEFFVELESGRGIAALLVAGFHCSLAPALISGTTGRMDRLTDANPFWQWLWNIQNVFVTGAGVPHQGVLFFFVLSGFVLTDSLLRGSRDLRPAAGRFSLTRFLRIYPAIAATILVFCATHFLAGLHLDPNIYTPRSILRNLLLIETSIDGVMWTLQVEFLALPLIFLAFWLKTRLGIGAVLIFTLILALLSFWGPWIRVLHKEAPSPTAYLVAFLIGVLGYHLGRRFCPGLSRRRTSVAFLLAVAFFFGIGFLIHKVWGMLFKAIASAAIMALLAFAPQIAASAPLRARPLRFVGRVSYSFYLLHPLSLFVIYQQPALLGNWIERGVPRVLILWGLWAATVLAILPLALLMYRFAEVPFIRLGKRLWKSASPRAAVGQE